MGERDQIQDVGNKSGGSERDAEIPTPALTVDTALTFFRELQEGLHSWRIRNFPETEDDGQLFGVVEEVGELCRHFLKQREGIRGSYQEHEVEIKDAIGDILIYLAGFCSFRNYDLMKIYYRTSHRVMKRDWIADPQRGGESDKEGTPASGCPDCQGEVNSPKIMADDGYSSFPCPHPFHRPNS